MSDDMRPVTPVAIDTQSRPHVELKFNIWPQIYDGAPPYLFPTEEAAHRFAANSVRSGNIDGATVYSAGHQLLRHYG